MNVPRSLSLRSLRSRLDRQNIVTTSLVAVAVFIGVFCVLPNDAAIISEHVYLLFRLIISAISSMAFGALMFLVFDNYVAEPKIAKYKANFKKTGLCK